MKKEKITISLYTVSRILFLVLLIPMLLDITNVADTEFHGYGVDTHSNLYIGRSHQIEVYHSETLVQTIELPRYRNWAFSVEDDTIILSDVTSTYEMDLSGNVLSEQPETAAERYAQMRKCKEVTGPDGTVYKRTAPLGWTRIIAEDDCIYRIPFWDYILNLTLDIFVPVLFILSLLFLWHQKRKSKANDNTEA